MDDPVQTPFPSPTPAAPQELPIPDRFITDYIRNEHTPFKALRRQTSYQQEISVPVAIIMDNISIDPEMYDEEPGRLFQGKRLDRFGYCAPERSSSQQRSSEAPSRIGHLKLDLRPLFERVYLVKSGPLDIRQRPANLENGMLVMHDYDNLSWQLGGINIVRDNETIIYRAYNESTSGYIFIVAPVEWSKEGMELSTKYDNV
jgi:hypothetical protein